MLAAEVARLPSAGVANAGIPMRVVLTIDGAPQNATKRMLRAASWLFSLAGIAALAYVGYALFDLYRFQNVEAVRFEAGRLAPQPPMTKPVPIALGDVIGEIALPRLGLKAVVVQGDSDRLLRRSVGHLPQSALPGEVGNVVLAGHRDGLFRPLRNVQPGDVITLVTPTQDFHYRVSWTAIVPPTATEMISPSNELELTLVTCYPFYYIGAAPKRFIVRATGVPAGQPM